MLNFIDISLLELFPANIKWTEYEEIMKLTRDRIMEY